MRNSEAVLALLVPTLYRYIDYLKLINDNEKKLNYQALSNGPVQRKTKENKKARSPFSIIY